MKKRPSQTDNLPEGISEAKLSVQAAVPQGRTLNVSFVFGIVAAIFVVAVVVTVVKKEPSASPLDALYDPAAERNEIRGLQESTSQRRKLAGETDEILLVDEIPNAKNDTASTVEKELAVLKSIVRGGRDKAPAKTKAARPNKPEKRSRAHKFAGLDYEYERKAYRLRKQAQLDAFESSGSSNEVPQPRGANEVVAKRDHARNLVAPSDAALLGAGSVRNRQGWHGQIAATPGERQQTFLAANRQHHTPAYLASKIHGRQASYEIYAGTFLSAVMKNGIHSDLPGGIVAQISENVYDSTNESACLIPMGSKVVGSYDSGIAGGQERVLVVWNELIFPNGDKLALAGMQGHSKSGYSGLSDIVNSHLRENLGKAIMLSMITGSLNIASQNAQPTAAVASYGSAAETEMSKVVTELIRRGMNRAPTIEIRPGMEISIFTDRTMMFDSIYVDGC